ncbi:hypothetical protein [Chryseobacterium sp. 3008163]|uniref:hypothetical protein n=1 Tax=Chryseobacterium sp. 3008163 TaxID=2478663 RepID=UPI0013ED06A3|nr:hypothetical protein [Chryseobacterium sp. 3008163]
MNSKIKISIKHPTGFPKNSPRTNFTIPNMKIEIRKYNVVLEILSLNNFNPKTEL